MNSVDDVTVTRDISLKKALEILDQSGLSVLLLIGPDGSLRRAVTDGDIRRLLLAGFRLEDTLEHLKSTHVVTVKEGATPENILAVMDKHLVDQIPSVDADNKPVGLYIRREIQPRIQLSIPHLGEFEHQYVNEAFESNWIAPLGPNVDAFESEVAEHVGSGYAAALSSGTAALHLALKLLEVGPGDVVLCSSFTFVASANPILYQGAEPVFIDSEPETWNISPEALEIALREYSEMGRKPKAIIVVHLYGQSANMERIMALSEAYDVPVVEDAAESLGALYQGRYTGTFGKFGVFSFNGNKIITTSGGGMLVSDDGDLIEKARFISTQARDPAPHYEHTEVGYNYRMSNVLAGIGRGQLKVLDSRVQARRAVFLRYKDGLAGLDCIGWMPEPEGYYSNRWLSALYLKPKKTTVTPAMLIKALEDANIESRHLWKPMHQQPLFEGCQYYTHGKEGFCDFLFQYGVCLPSASNMTVCQQQIVIHRIMEVLQKM